MRIDLSCNICRSNSFTLDGVANGDPMIACDHCGRKFGTLSKLKEELGNEVLIRGAATTDPPGGTKGNC